MFSKIRKTSLIVISFASIASKALADNPRLIYSEREKNYYYQNKDDIYIAVDKFRAVETGGEFTDGFGKKHTLVKGDIVFTAKDNKEYVGAYVGSKFAEDNTCCVIPSVSGTLQGGFQLPQGFGAETSGLSQIEQDIVNATNNARIQAGLRPLAVDPSLMQNSRSWAGSMASSGRLVHSRMNVAENIAWNHSSGADAVGGWLRSPGHRANLLNPGHTFIGVGQAQGGNGPYYVQQFR